MSKFPKTQKMLKQADYYSSPVTKEQIAKLRQKRREALAQGKKFNIGDHASAGIGQHLKNIADVYGAYQKGRWAGAVAPVTSAARKLGFDQWADRANDRLAQWSGASKESLQTGGDIGLTGYQLLASAAGAGALGHLGRAFGLGSKVVTAAKAGKGLRLGTRLAASARKAKGVKDLVSNAYKTRGLTGLVNVGARGAGKAIQLAGKGAWGLTKGLLPYDLIQGGAEWTARSLNNYKVNVARALAQGDQSYLKTDKERALFNDIVSRQGLGKYDPEDPQSWQKWQDAGLQLMDNYRRNVGYSNIASSAPMLFSKGKIIKGLGALGVISPLLGFSGGDKASWELAHTPGAYKSQSAGGTAMQDLLQRDYRLALLSNITPVRYGLYPLARKFGLLPNAPMYNVAKMTNQKLNQQGVDVPQDYKTSPQDRETLGRVSNTMKQQAQPGLIQQGVNFAARTFGKPMVEQQMMQNMKIFRDLGQAQTQEEKAKILAQIRQKSRDFLNPAEAGLMQGAKRQAFNAFVQDPKARQQMVQNFVKTYNPKDKAAIIRGYREAMNNPSYAHSVNSMSQSMANSMGDLTNQMVQAQEANFRQGLKDTKDLYGYLNSYGELIDEIKTDSISQDSPTYKAVKEAIFNDLKKNPLNFNKAFGFWARTKGWKTLAEGLSNNGIFYGGLAAAVGLPLTIMLLRSIFGGNQPQVIVNNNQSPAVQTYTPRGITQRGLAIG